MIIKISHMNFMGSDMKLIGFDMNMMGLDMFLDVDFNLTRNLDINISGRK